MAEDVIVLLDYIGWTAKQSIHVVGVSLGGMISQGKPDLSFPSTTLLTSLGRTRIQNPGENNISDFGCHHRRRVPVAEFPTSTSNQLQNDSTLLTRIPSGKASSRYRGFNLSQTPKRRYPSFLIWYSLRNG